MNENAISEPELILPSLKANRNERRGVEILSFYVNIIWLSNSVEIGIYMGI